MIPEEPTFVLNVNIVCLQQPNIDTLTTDILSSTKAYIVLSQGKILQRRRHADILNYQQVMTQPSLQPSVLGLLTHK